MEAVWKIEVEDFPAFIVIDHEGQNRAGPTWLDRFAAKLIYSWLVDAMPRLSIYEGQAPHKFEFYYRPHRASVH